MNEIVRRYLERKEQEKRFAYEREKKALLEREGIVERQYTDLNHWSEEYPYYDYEGNTGRYYKRVPIDVTDEEYELIKEAIKSQDKLSQTQGGDYEATAPENAVASALAVIAWVIYLGGGFAGLILLENILVSIICWVSCFVAGTIFLGFSEIIKLLNDIKHKE